MASDSNYQGTYSDLRKNSRGSEVSVTTETGTSKETIVSTIGPRGYKPKYGVTESGNVVELYSGPLIEQSLSSEVYNWDFVNINEIDMPFFLSNLGPYNGKTDSERLIWLQDQMTKMEAVAKIYADKIKEISAGEPDLTKIVAAALVTVGGKLLSAVPPAGAVVAGVGLIIQFLHNSKSKEILAFKNSKILEWSTIIKTLQTQYLAYNKEISQIKNRKLVSICAALVFFIVVKSRSN